MHSNTVDDDALLWHQFQQGDSASLGKLMTKHYTALIHYGTKFNRNTDFIRDCMQDIFVELWNRRATLSSLSTAQVRPYLMTMLRRLLHQHYLDQQRYDFQPISEDSDTSFFDISFSPEDQFISNENLHQHANRVGQLLDKLPRRAKEAIYLRFYENLDRSSIAQIMGISEQSVSNLFQTTFRQLRQQINTEFFWLCLLLFYWL
ncbi:sigma-70 family RNA polymerase sigma factor [Spirosoma sp. BT702]|uniref:Sigma-70 family RNA polymerase sigma factor n=1 Tax=Spirosoma profusum TaxID=2771354 RepID=A0A926XWV7_9BACT|nr:sigma-70 family RNA polymerase sigma factor [Spirosoma profusum]MBD2702069.1 sigma-70 family RNA polymerase sigma factor [Spirosoma profusum]